MIFSRLLLVPLVLLTALFFYLGWKVDPQYSLYAVPFVLLGAVVLIMAPQINWWWWIRYPPGLPSGARHMLSHVMPFYQRLDEAGRKVFDQRCALYQQAHAYTAKAIKTVAPDIQLMLAAYAVQVSWAQGDFLLEPYEHIVLYPHPFPTPRFQQLHTSESHAEDGVLIFSVPHLSKGFLEPGQHYPSGLHEYVHIFHELHRSGVRPLLTDDDWPALEAMTGFSQAMVQKWVGMETIDPWQVGRVYFLQYPKAFQQQLPQVYESLTKYFGYDPLHPLAPEVVIS